jgi:Tol biopolymer transport system component
MVRPNGEGMKLLVEYASPEEGRSHEEWPPLPVWSPDGEWLAYHKCILDPGPKVDCSEPSDGINFSIFVVNVDTGHEKKVIDGGLNPYWR